MLKRLQRRGINLPICVGVSHVLVRDASVPVHSYGGIVALVQGLDVTPVLAVRRQQVVAKNTPATSV